MKKIVSLALAALGIGLLVGCTTVETAEKFNGLPIGEGSPVPPKAHVNAKISGFYLFGVLPIVTGSVASPGKVAVFKDTVTLENAVSVLTRSARGMGGVRVYDLNSARSSFSFPLLFSIESVQATGTVAKDPREP